MRDFKLIKTNKSWLMLQYVWQKSYNNGAISLHTNAWLEVISQIAYVDDIGTEAES